MHAGAREPPLHHRNADAALQAPTNLFPSLLLRRSHETTGEAEWQLLLGAGMSAFCAHGLIPLVSSLLQFLFLCRVVFGIKKTAGSGEEKHAIGLGRFVETHK